MLRWPIFFNSSIIVNDIYKNISPETKVSLYTDDTKIWRNNIILIDFHITNMRSYQDHIILQNVIDSLHKWYLIIEMNFQPDKYKVLSVCNKKVPWINILPFSKFPYELNSLMKV